METPFDYLVTEINGVSLSRAYKMGKQAGMKEVVEWLHSKGSICVRIPVDEVTPVQWVGCYTTRWGKDSEPTQAFYTLDYEALKSGKMPKEVEDGS